jgi:hypothetical protein
MLTRRRRHLLAALLAASDGAPRGRIRDVPVGTPATIAG